MKTTAKAGLYKSVKSSPFCPSESGLTVLTNLQIWVQHTARGMHITKTLEVSSSCQGSWKPHITLILIPRKCIHIKMIWVQRPGLLREKKLQVVISTASVLLEKKTAIIQSITNSNWETLLMRKTPGYTWRIHTVLFLRKTCSLNFWSKLWERQWRD